MPEPHSTQQPTSSSRLPEDSVEAAADHRLKVAIGNLQITTTTPNQPNQDSPLLRLPAELRNPIYAYVFSTHNFPINTTSLVHKKSPQPNIMTLLYTCRQIHSEAHLLPYTLNTATLNYTPASFPKFQNLRADLRAAITSVELTTVACHTSAPSRRTPFEDHLWRETVRGPEYLALLPRLQTVTVVVLMGGLYRCEGERRRTREYVEGWVGPDVRVVVRCTTGEF